MTSTSRKCHQGIEPGTGPTSVALRLGLPRETKMEMSLATFFGLGAVICTTVAYVPQVLKAWRTRSTGDVSLGMFLFMVIGMGCWLVYGLLIRDIPLIIANAITMSLASVILILKLRHG